LEQSSDRIYWLRWEAREDGEVKTVNEVLVSPQSPHG